MADSLPKANSLSNRIIGAISSNPILASLAGKAGKAIDIYGRVTGQKTPELNISEKLESIGGYAQTTDPTLTPDQKAVIEKKAQKRAGFPSAAVATLPRQTESPPPKISATTQDYSKTIDPNNLDKLIIMFDGSQKTGRTILAETGGTGIYTTTTGGGNNAPTYNTREVIASVPGNKYLGEGDINDLIKNYGSQVSSNAEQLAKDIEARATAAADREYQGILSLLGGQKTEVGTLSKQQREAAGTQKELTAGELTAKQETETETIQGEKESFTEETKQTVEVLARNWRDLSLEMQRIMRARGVSDSAFASGKETDLMLNFNTGLRTIATKSTAALADFSTAVDETVKFYTRQKTKLDFDTNQQVQEIDNWERQQVAAIQGQQTMAYNRKLDAIENAMTQADTLRVNTANTLAEKKLTWGLWLVQMDYQYKTAVAEAAKTSVGNASTKVNDARNLFKMTADILDNGGEIIPTKDKDGNITGGNVHGILPTTGEDVYLPITAGGTTNLLLKQAGNIYGTMNKNNETSNMINNNPALSTIYNQISGGQQPAQSTSQPGTMQGILDSIKAMF